jgi:hypothetical protein
MADKKQMLSAEEAHRRAARVRQLVPGFTVTLRLEVALAVMKQRDLIVNRWLGDGSILEVRKNQNGERGKEQAYVSEIQEEIQEDQASRSGSSEAAPVPGETCAGAARQT